MPALPALLLSIHFSSFLLVTMAPRSGSQAALLSSVRMAAILDDQSVCGRGERLALALARENINSVMEGGARARVEVDIFELQRDSQYETTDTMCQILPKGVVSVIGPANSPASGSTVSHICGEKEIPHVKIGPEETPRLPYLRFASVSLYPSNEDLSLAVAAILRSFSYPSASLVCAKAEFAVLSLRCNSCMDSGEAKHLARQSTTCQAPDTVLRLSSYNCKLLYQTIDLMIDAQ
eukprot:XP_014057330.1 PREDICTED: glutamate receptor ionotropic, kainate 5-like isoform X1 [Salmo salar]